MIEIVCPNNNIPERTYAINALLSDVLGCKQEDYNIRYEEDSAYVISFVGDGKKIIIEDHFFNRYPEPFSYLKKESIPETLRYFHGLGMDVPIIYGEDKFVQKENGAVIGLDIFASTFFMLTRWEESLLGREEKGDCDESQLFCVKHGIHHRPIVNEYAELLRKLLPSPLLCATHNYKVILSHDVDGFLTPTWMTIGKAFVRQTIKGAPQNRTLHLTWKDEIRYKKAFPRAWSQFDIYTKSAEKFDIEEWFYFKVCAKGETEATYGYDSQEAKSIVGKLKSKHNPKVVLGFHPSQNTFGNRDQWSKEVERIKGLLNDTPIIGRNHHLLYNYETLRLWESITETPLHISNCVFHKRLGFRSGVCVPYRLFDLYQRRVMNLIEHPCQIMDTVIRYDEKVKSANERWLDIQSVIDFVKHYQGELVLTWHIYIRNRMLIQDYFNWCEKVIQYAVKE